MPEDTTSITALLRPHGAGDETALDRRVGVVYSESHRLARRLLLRAGLSP